MTTDTTNLEKTMKHELTLLGQRWADLQAPRLRHKAARTASDVIADQHSTIREAIALFQIELDAMTSCVDPDTESWRDVSKFAHVADMARDVVESYEEE